ncbi:MAG: primosomal protein N' [Bacilli bacterium]|nr:primosomal protein N' [Bacilli bacterium]
MFAKVVVDVKSSNVDIMYTYRIPEEYHDYVNIGSRVLVSFGVREILGYIIEIVEDVDYEGQIKDIIDVLDFDKELTIEQVELAKKISIDTKCLMVSALSLMYPSFLKTKYRKYLNIKNYPGLDADLALMFSGRNKIVIDKEILKNFPKIKKEIEKDNIEITYDNYSYGKNKRVKHYTFNPDKENDLDNLSIRRYDALAFIKNNPESTMDEIRENVGCSRELINNLTTQGYLNVDERIVIKKVSAEKLPIINDHYIFDEQEVRTKYLRLSGKPFLLYSNDDDFKFKFYLDVVKDALQINKKVMILAPTLITYFRLLKFFRKKMIGYQIVNFSSEISNNEFYDNYMNVKNGEFDLIIATKVGAFLPIIDLGAIIVVDEEDVNYYSESSPKYNIVEVVKFRADFHQAKLIFSTSSPTVVTYYNYFLTKYFLLRYNIKKENDIELVNMMDDIGESDMMISTRLEQEIATKMRQKEMSMLILNAKGYSSHIVCRNCSTVVKCPSCKIPMTYHKKKDQIVCRYCGYKLATNNCNRCGSSDLNFLSYGLEQVNERILQLFPKAKVLQLDSETISDYESYQNALLKIEEQEVDIILGTNNILLLKNEAIKLIGILDIDRLLNINDFKASEMTYSLLNRALAYTSTKTIIQGYTLNHYAILCGINNDFDGFYDQEIKYREECFYPPFAEANRLIISGDFKGMYHYANSFKKSFNYLFKEKGTVLGPVYLTKYMGVQLIIKHNDFAKVNRIIDEVTKNLTQYQLTIIFERYPRYFN